MTFKTELIVRPIRYSNYRTLERALIYEAIDGKVFVIGRGFMTDYASIPKCMRAWVDQDSGRIREAAILHDYLYTMGTEYSLTRSDADRYFYQSMRELGMPLIKAKLIWLAVRLFGAKYWK